MRASTLAAAGLGLLALGLGVGATVFPQGSYLGERESSSGQQPTVVAVIASTSADPVAVALDATVADAWHLPAPGSGTLTATSCTPGGTLRSGEVVGSVGDRVFGALHTEVPLWRDLAVGAEGNDVRALTAELVRLGAPVKEVTVLDRATASAVRDFLNGRGFDLGKARLATGVVVLPMEKVVWLPQDEIQVATCDAPLGGVVEIGASLASTQQKVVSLKAVTVPQGRLPGERELQVGDVHVVLPTGGVISDPADVDAVMASEPGKAYLDGGMQGTITGEYALVTPVDVLAVPPAALIDAAGPSPCVRTESGDALPVTILANSLGRVLVRLDPAAGEAPTRVRLDLDGTATCQ